MQKVLKVRGLKKKKEAIMQEKAVNRKQKLADAKRLKKQKAALKKDIIIGKGTLKFIHRPAINDNDANESLFSHILYIVITHKYKMTEPCIMYMWLYCVVL